MAGYRPPHVGRITRRTFIGTTAIVVLGPVVDAQRAAGPAGLDRKTLTAAVDGIIPAGETMPAASAAGAVGYIERLAAREPELAQQFSRALAALGAGFSGFSEPQQVEALRTLERTDPPAFAALRDAVYEAYYTNPPSGRDWATPSGRARRRRRLSTPFDPAPLARVQQLPKMYRETLIDAARIAPTSSSSAPARRVRH